MADRRCERTDLVVEQCAHCKGQQSVDEQVLAVRARLLRHPAWFASQYPGKCDACGEPFAPGTAIRMELRHGWIAECCAEERIDRV